MKQGAQHRSYHNKQTWRQLIGDWSGSGLGQREFCNQRGVGYSTFCKWKKRILSESPSPVSELIEIMPSSERVSGWDVELELGAGVILRFRRG